MPRRMVTALALVLGVLAFSHSALATWAACDMAQTGPCCCNHGHTNPSAPQDCDAMRAGPCCCSASAQDHHSTVAEAPRLQARHAVAGLVLLHTTGLHAAPCLERGLQPAKSVRATAGPPLFLQSGALLI